ncbi:MAG: hypothetical protein AAF498_11595 [Pseudomonadota bacterium]
MGWVSSIQKLVELTSAVERLNKNVDDLLAIMAEQKDRITRLEARENELLAKAEMVALEKSSEATQKMNDQLARLSFEVGRSTTIREHEIIPANVLEPASIKSIGDE